VNATGILRGCLPLVVAAMAACGAAAQAQTYPVKPIRIVVGFAPGGPSDIISRLVGTKMGEILGQQLVIENKTGAGGTIATEAVGRADPDGYTILNAPLANAVTETLYPTG
jgi:tripartite-type tricarboxylate transporter receptor subunit TctC